MASIKEIQKIILLENERNAINARIDQLLNSYLWTDEETDVLLPIYEKKLKDLNKSLDANPWK